MIELAGTWELGWSAPVTEYEQWWAVMRSFDVTRLNMTPVSGINKRWVHEYASYEGLLEDRDLAPVFVDENAEVELKDFEHPDNAVYCFGKASYSPFTAMSAGGVSVRIRAPGSGMFWPHQAAAVVLYDRLMKA